MNSRELILNKIKASLSGSGSRVPGDPDVDQQISDSLAEITPENIDSLAGQFHKELELVSGEFQSAKNEQQALQIVQDIFSTSDIKSFTCTSAPLPSRFAEALKTDYQFIPTGEQEARKNRLAQATAGLVDVDHAIADSGTLVVRFDRLDSTLPHFLPDVIIAFVYKDQLLANHFELFDKIDPDAAKNMTLITGPSRTADIEKILILGAHGPRRLVVIFIDQR